jgi:hypothetical protein
MNNFLWTTTGHRTVATLWRQLCSSLLHSWTVEIDREACWQ